MGIDSCDLDNSRFRIFAVTYRASIQPSTTTIGTKIQYQIYFRSVHTYLSVINKYLATPIIPADISVSHQTRQIW